MKGENAESWPPHEGWKGSWGPGSTPKIPRFGFAVTEKPIHYGVPSRLGHDLDTTDVLSPPENRSTTESSFIQPVPGKYRTHLELRGKGAKSPK